MIHRVSQGFTVRVLQVLVAGWICGWQWQWSWNSHCVHCHQPAARRLSRQEGDRLEGDKFRCTAPMASSCRIIFFHVWCADLTWFDTAENVCLLCTGMAVHTTLLRGTSPELIGKSCCFKWGLASVLCSFALATLKRNLLWDTCPLGSGIHGRYCLKTSGYRS